MKYIFLTFILLLKHISSLSKCSIVFQGYKKFKDKIFV